jgi:hypothetical protein
MTTVATHDTTLMMRRASEVAGVKRLAAAMGCGTAHMHRLLRDPADLSDNPDATGARNMLDHVEAACGVLATRGDEGRVVLVEWREWFDGLFELLLGERPATLTAQRRQHHVATLSREFADVLRELVEDGADKAALRRELAELVQVAERVMGEAQP